MSKLWFPAAVLAAIVFVSGCNGDSNKSAGIGAVTVTRTTYGIPHVKADTFEGAGYGLGYAFAEDNLCILLEDMLTIRGERSKYFGRNGPAYSIPANGSLPDNITGDFFWKLLADSAAVERIRAKAAPDAIAATRGYKNGLNRYIRELKAGQHAGRHATCRNQPWLAEISEDDMYRRYFRLSLLASSSVFSQGIGSAQPPGAQNLGGVANGGLCTPATVPVLGGQCLPLDQLGALPTASIMPPLLPKIGPSAAELTQLAAMDRSELPFPLNPELPFGSNMYGLGKDATENGVPMLFGNPHFPWEGTERLYISHLTIPGVADIEGASLYGVPAILIGFNRHFAWSHTVSTAYRFTFYELTLMPGDPTSYIYNGEVRALTPVPLTIDVKEDDGTMTQAARTLYRSHFGPMVSFKVSGVDILPWTVAKAYTLRDANAENDRLINQFFAWNKAKSLDEFKSLHKSILGVPWVNTVAAAPSGKVYYGDVTVVPNVPDSKAQTCGTSVQAVALTQLAPGLPLLDGSRADCEWDTDADAPAPGIFGPGNLPTLERDDWVGNFNDSYWLTNPAEPVTGYAKIIGAEETARSLRTRKGILQVQERLAGADGRAGNKFNLDNLQEIVLSSEIYSAELERDSTVGNLCALGNLLGSSGPVDVAAACAVLADWDMTNNRNSVGGHLWREYWRGASRNPGGLPAGVPVVGNWTTPFSADDPVNTPRGLNYALPTVQQALADAVKKFEDLGIPPDARFGAVQHSGVNGNSIELFGGEGNMEGAFTIARGPLTEQGYGVVFGNSYIQTVTWDKVSGNPIAEGFITYSQSTDPANPHYNDYTKAYSDKQWNVLPFTEAQIEAARIGPVLELRP